MLVPLGPATALLATSGLASATTYTVTSTANSGAGTLRLLVNAFDLPLGSL